MKTLKVAFEINCPLISVVGASNFFPRKIITFAAQAGQSRSPTFLLNCHLNKYSKMEFILFSYLSFWRENWIQCSLGSSFKIVRSCILWLRTSFQGFIKKITVIHCFENFWFRIWMKNLKCLIIFVLIFVFWTDFVTGLPANQLIIHRLSLFVLIFSQFCKSGKFQMSQSRFPIDCVQNLFPKYILIMWMWDHYFFFKESCKISHHYLLM